MMNDKLEPKLLEKRIVHLENTIMRMLTTNETQEYVNNVQKAQIDVLLSQSQKQQTEINRLKEMGERASSLFELLTKTVAGMTVVLEEISAGKR